jgi:pimeloyl-ACP methyl ester carboxylesterase
MGAAGARTSSLKPEEHVVEVAGAPVRYRAAGDGPPLVLVHGLAGSTRWWSRNLPALASRHRVHLVDLPGFGAMARGRTRFVLRDAASWLLAWLDAVGAAPASIVAHSMGARIALAAASERPDAVDRLVLVAPAGLDTGRSLAAHAAPLALAAARGGPRFVPLLVRDALRAGPRTLLRAARDLLDDDVHAALASVRAPTLLVFGAHDRLVPAALGEVYCRELADARLVVLERAGHVPMLEQPGRFDAVVLAFLAGRPVADP